MKNLNQIPFILLILLAACSPSQEEKEVDEETKDALSEILATDKVELVADGFDFTEGPVWWAEEAAWLFSDIPASIIYKVDSEGEVSEFINPSGKSNGLIFDQDGHLIAVEHEGRQVTRHDLNGGSEVIVATYQGKQLNSPNDIVQHSSGDFYFTDPPYGLSDGDDDDDKELSFNGVFRYADGDLVLLDSSFVRPNGLVFTPDESHLYIAQSDSDAKIIKKFPLNENGTLGDGVLIYDGTDSSESGAPDGMKVSENGYLFATGPGGIHVFSPDDQHLGTIEVPQVPTNLAFGGADGNTLFITAQSGVYKVQLKVKGATL